MMQMTRPALLWCCLTVVMAGCSTSTHTYRFTASGFEPPWVFEFDADAAGELEEVWTPDSSLWRFTTEGYVMHVDIGMRSWLDRSEEQGYRVELIEEPFPHGELVQFNLEDQYMAGLPFRAMMQSRKTSVRPRVHAATEQDRERGIAAMRSIRWLSD